MNDVKVMNRAADNIRILAASMVEKSQIRPSWRSYGRRRFYQRIVLRVFGVRS